jgi:hypothetical protein
MPGKTTMLLALLNVLHNAATQNHYELMLGGAMSTVRAQRAQRDAQAGSMESILQCHKNVHAAGASADLSQLRGGRILVCAHSNTAVDELLCRLLRGGFDDTHGRSYMPDVVRLGANASHDVGPCTLDTRIAERFASLRKHGATGSELSARRQDAQFQLHRHEGLRHQYASI